MKLKSTLLLTLSLLVTILGAGLGTGWYSYKIGAEALEGVSQPDVNPTRKITGNQENSDNPQEFTPIDEKKVIADTVAYLNKQKKETKLVAAGDKGEKESSFLKDSQDSAQKSAETEFPLTVTDRGITLEVARTEIQGSSLILEVSLKNDSPKVVEFLYSFLEVKDNQGNSLSAITDGLPATLPANGEKFRGTIEVPAASVAGGAEISVNLTDYPEQKLQLSLANIPVSQ